MRERERSVWQIISVNTVWKSKGERREGGGKCVGGKLRGGGAIRWEFPVLVSE